MKISNRVNRNISGILMSIGILLIFISGYEVVGNPTSGKARFELCGMVVLTYLQIADFISYRKRVREGIKYGKANPINKS